MESRTACKKGWQKQRVPANKLGVRRAMSRVIGNTKANNGSATLRAFPLIGTRPCRLPGPRTRTYFLYLFIYLFIFRFAVVVVRLFCCCPVFCRSCVGVRNSDWIALAFQGLKLLRAQCASLEKKTVAMPVEKTRRETFSAENEPQGCLCGSACGCTQVRITGVPRQCNLKEITSKHRARNS